VISAYESDSNCIPNAQVLSKLEAALGVKLRGTLD
jgi:ribosome-binding protein aMBF1 (putative translation factor)